MKDKIRKYLKKSLKIFFTLFILLNILNGLDYSQKITKKEALEDYNYVWDNLESNYPFFPLIKEETDVDYRVIRQKYFDIISGYNENISIKKFYMDLNECLMEFLVEGRDVGHLVLVSPDYFDMLYHAKKEMPEILNLDIIKSNIDTYKQLKKPFSFRTRLGSNSQRENLSYENPDDSTVIMTIKSFYSQFEKSDGEKILEILKDNNLKSLILDMRYNNGGSDFYWMENIVAPNIDEPLYGTGEKAYFMNGDIAKINIQKFKDWGFKVEEVDDIIYEQKFKYLVEKSTSYYVEPKLEEKLFKGDIYVLTSKNNSSAVDSFAQFCKDTGFAKLVGEQTRGNSPFINPNYLNLKNSSLIVAFQTDFKLNSDGSPNVLGGAKPDIGIEDIPNYREH